MVGLAPGPRAGARPGKHCLPVSLGPLGPQPPWVSVRFPGCSHPWPVCSSSLSTPTLRVNHADSAQSRGPHLACPGRRSKACEVWSPCPAGPAIRSVADPLCDTPVRGPSCFSFPSVWKNQNQTSRHEAAQEVRAFEGPFTLRCHKDHVPAPGCAECIGQQLPQG